jgi:iron-regulated ABC-type transporter membrane component
MGRLDEELLFYLETRGIPKKQVYEIMAMARIENVINKIEDNETKVKLLKYIKGEENE